MSEQSEAPQKIWLEYTTDEQHLHLADDLVWTGYLTEYVRADCHERLVEALRDAADSLDVAGEWRAYKKARTLLAKLEAEKGGE